MKNLILFLFTILLSSCINEKVNSGFGFQKRKHREGWSIDLLQKNNQNFTKIEKQNDQTSKSEVNKIENQFIYNLDNTYSEKSIEIQSYFDDKCDTIITKDGLIIYAIISSYNDYEIKYKLCEDINATNIIKSTAFIEKIKLKNGKTIEYNENKIDENRIETYAKQEEKEIKKNMETLQMKLNKLQHLPY